MKLAGLALLSVFLFLPSSVTLPLNSSSVWFHWSQTSEMEKGTTYRFDLSLCMRDIDYRNATLLQLDSFIIPSTWQVNERATGPLEKTRSGWRIVCIVVVALE